MVVQVVPANWHDSTTMLPLLVDMPAVAGKPGRPKWKPEKIVADKAFDDESLRRILRWLGIEPALPKRGDDERGLGIWRWFVERTISWLHQFRRLRIRWDRRPEIHQAFLSLAATVICYRIYKRK
jgi:hypothetical protein